MVDRNGVLGITNAGTPMFEQRRSMAIDHTDDIRIAMADVLAMLLHRIDQPDEELLR